MEIALFMGLLSYCVYLNLRLREVQEELLEIELDVSELDIRVYNKMMEIRGDIKRSTKQNVNEYLNKSRRTKKRNKVEKPRGRSTKGSSKIPMS